MQELGRLLPVRGDCRAQRDETGMVVGFGLVLLLKSSIAVFDFPWKGGQGESSQGCAGSGGRCLPSRYNAGCGDKEGDFGQGQKGE